LSKGILCTIVDIFIIVTIAMPISLLVNYYLWLDVGQEVLINILLKAFT